MVSRKLFEIQTRRWEKERERRKYHPTKEERKMDEMWEKEKQYRIVYSVRGSLYSEEDKIAQLESSVLRMMKQGWQPIGGVAVSIVPGDEWPTEITFYQAMIKIE